VLTLINTLRSLDFQEYKFIYIYSDLREFGHGIQTNDDKLNFLRDLMSELLGTGCTIVIPTFTYTDTGVFETNSTRTNLGALNKFIQNDSRSIRSEHPLFSFSSVGPESGFLKNIGKSSFGNDSVFARLIGQRATFLNIGRPISAGNTLVHYVEDQHNAFYRIHKKFDTQVFSDGKYIGTDYSAFLRRRDIPDLTFETKFELAAREIYAKGRVSRIGEPESYSGVFQYDYDRTLEILTGLFKSNSSAFI
jgi:aminoglycoside N3'-acetyltransferase